MAEVEGRTNAPMPKVRCPACGGLTLVDCEGCKGMGWVYAKPPRIQVEAPLTAPPPDLAEWSEPFSMTVRYEVQVTHQMRAWLHEMKARESDLAEEIVSRLHNDHHVNVVDSDPEFDCPLSEVMGRG